FVFGTTPSVPAHLLFAVAPLARSATIPAPMTVIPDGALRRSGTEGPRARAQPLHHHTQAGRMKQIDLFAFDMNCVGHIQQGMW
ncbi:hypothetical protein ABTI02_20060, partial [Acinetobacter baumannii]